jgi:hypothetical protein
MIGCITIDTTDSPRARAFYDALLAEIGVMRLMESGSRSARSRCISGAFL